MARRAFFSFHYQNDIWRVSQVRNSWVTQDRTTAGFWDAARWEAVKKGGDEAIKKWIDKELDGTSVTVVLIGEETSTRKYVKHEIKRGFELGKGLLGVYIHKQKNQDGEVSSKGANPFDLFDVQHNGRTVRLSDLVATYDWTNDDGYNNFADWVETAANAAGR